MKLVDVAKQLRRLCLGSFGVSHHVHHRIELPIRACLVANLDQRVVAKRLIVHLVVVTQGHYLAAEPLNTDEVGTARSIAANLIAILVHHVGDG